MAFSEALLVDGETNGRASWTGMDMKGGRDDMADEAI